MLVKKSLAVASACVAFASAAYSFAIYGAIEAKWRALGAEHGPLGDVLSDETSAKYGGRFNKFKSGFVYWHPDIGAFGVWGLIGEKWAAAGFEDYGYPITDETGASDGKGRFNHFRAVQLAGKPESSIYWTQDTGAHTVFGAIRAKWAELGWEHYGYPITDESTAPDGVGKYNHFRDVNKADKPEASIYWTPQTGAVPVYGDIRKEWAQLGWERSSLGYPTAPEYQESPGVRRQKFQKGAIWWSASTGAQLTPVSAQCNPARPLQVSIAHQDGLGPFTVHGTNFTPNDYVLLIYQITTANGLKQGDIPATQVDGSGAFTAIIPRQSGEGNVSIVAVKAVDQASDQCLDRAINL